MPVRVANRATATAGMPGAWTVPKTERLHPSGGTSDRARQGISKPHLPRSEVVAFANNTVARLLHMALRMNQTTPSNNEFESTYALLVRSEEKNRSNLETFVYVLLVLSAIFSIWQFAHQSLKMPADKVAHELADVIEAQRS